MIIVDHSNYVILNLTVFKNISVIGNLVKISRSNYAFQQSSIKNISSQYEYLIKLIQFNGRTDEFLCINCFPGLFCLKNSSFWMNNSLIQFDKSFERDAIMFFSFSAIYSEENSSFFILQNSKFLNLITQDDGAVIKKNLSPLKKILGTSVFRLRV